MSQALQDIAHAVGRGISTFAGSSGRAAASANAVSQQAQNAQAAFNSASVNNANMINSNSMASQWNYNAAQAAAANQFTEYMWDKSASWNESMWQKMADFNAEQAQLNREWQERMDNTKYQRAIKDMETAGLNPILAVTGGGVSASGLGGSSASVSAPSMSGATGAMSSGGLLGADSASISNYSGQMEYMGGMLGLLSAAISGISSAMSAMGGMGKFGEALGDAIGDIFSKPKEAVQETAKQTRDTINSVTPDSIEGTKNGYRNGVKWQYYKRDHGGSSGTSRTTGSSGNW